VLADINWHVTERLTELKLGNGDLVAAQTKLSLTRGYYVIGVALNYPYLTHHSVAVRLYRPGFEVVEVQGIEPVVWKPALDVKSQEEALDSLFPLEAKELLLVHRTLDVGSVSLDHRAALLFGAAEYERLAWVAPSEFRRTQLLTKAAHLRELASQ
jgi:hypothetical protein